MAYKALPVYYLKNRSFMFFYSRYEGLVLVVMYILYIVLMYFNRRLEEKAYAITGLVMSQWKPGIQEREAEEKQRLIDKNEPIMRYSIEDSTHDEANESRFGGLTMSATESEFSIM